MRKVINEQKFGLTTTTTTTKNRLLTPPVDMDPKVAVAAAAKSNDRFTKSEPCYAALQTPKRKVSLCTDTPSSHGTATLWTTEDRLHTEKVRPTRDVSETNSGAVQALSSRSISNTQPPTSRSQLTSPNFDDNADDDEDDEGKDICSDTNRLEVTADYDDRVSKLILTAGRILTSASSSKSSTPSKGECQKASPKTVTDIMADQTRRIVLQRCNINTCGDGDEEEELDSDIDDDDHFNVWS
jgi:hypothetical protein